MALPASSPSVEGIRFWNDDCGYLRCLADLDSAIMLFARWGLRTWRPMITTPGRVCQHFSADQNRALQMMLPLTFGWHEDCNDTKSFRTAGNGRR
jgi:hypothetical protein